jgi:hypothetical protein
VNTKSENGRYTNPNTTVGKSGYKRGIGHIKSATGRCGISSATSQN